MKIAVLCNGSNIAQTLEDAVQCAVYTIENDKMTSAEVLDFDGAYTVEFLKDHGVGILLCGKLPADCNAALTASGIAVFSGMSGNVDMQVGIIIMGMLGVNTASASTALHSCGDMTCSGDCSACHSAGK